MYIYFLPIPAAIGQDRKPLTVVSEMPKELKAKVESVRSEELQSAEEMTSEILKAHRWRGSCNMIYMSS